MNNPAFSFRILLLVSVLSAAAGCGSQAEVTGGRQVAVAQLSRGCGAGASAAAPPVTPPPPQPVVGMCR